MLAAILHGQNNLQIEEVPKPQISPDEVLLRCKAVSICGTDMQIYRFGHKDLPDNTKRILGHELAGEVAEVGQNVKGTREGTRVAVAPNFGCGICKNVPEGLVSSLSGLRSNRPDRGRRHGRIRSHSENRSSAGLSAGNACRPFF